MIHFDSEIRSHCKEKLESLEYWLRRLIDEILSKSYNNYFNYKDSKGNHIIKKSIRDSLSKRMKEQPERFTRLIDAALLNHEISIICNPYLYKNHFNEVLKDAFPEGREEAYTFMKRLEKPRNCLSHANPISLRDAERIICYSNDIIDSIKNYYIIKKMNDQYNVPLILKFTDSFGNEMYRNQINDNQLGLGGKDHSFANNPKYYLRPGDILTLEVEVDPSFDESEYIIKWTASPFDISESEILGKKIVINVSVKNVGEGFNVTCKVVSNKNWHRLSFGNDDLLVIRYKVLPPI